MPPRMGGKWLSISTRTSDLRAFARSHDQVRVALRAAPITAQELERACPDRVSPVAGVLEESLHLAHRCPLALQMRGLELHDEVRPSPLQQARSALERQQLRALHVELYERGALEQVAGHLVERRHADFHLGT